MKLVKFIVELRYPENIPDLFQFRQQIVSGLTEEYAPPPSLDDGISIYVKRKMMSISIENKRFGIDIILPRDIDYAAKNTLRVIDQINKNLKVERVARVGVRSIWLKEYSGNYDELVGKFKQMFVANVDQINRSSDMTIALTLNEDRNSINYVFAPVHKLEIAKAIGLIPERHGRDAIEAIPDISILLDYDYSATEVRRFNFDYLKTFAYKAIESCERNKPWLLDYFT